VNGKFDKLLHILKKMDSAVLAYSGGVDSTLLLKAVQLSGIKALAVTAMSETMPEHDLLYAKKFAEEIGVEHRIIKTDELDNDDFTNNPVNRCFFCKEGLFRKIKEIADKEGYRFILDGSNVDDMSDWRPGREAATRYNVSSPLVEAGLGKRDIREISKNLALPSWDRPSSPCLASRFPYGERITIDALRQVADAEEFLRSFGFIEFRVRHHGNTARIELRGDDMEKLLSPQVREAITEKFRTLGYRFVSLDLEGFRSGRMNEGIR
jgi:uncharacterized protein